MKLALLLLLVSFTATATTAPAATVDCDINQRIIISTTWGNTVFNQAEVQFWNLTKDARMSSAIIQDRFGSAYEQFNQLWTENIRCMGNDFCVSTDFSSFRGLTFSFPQEIFTQPFMNFTSRVRDNNNNRTYFANCRSRLQ